MLSLNSLVTKFIAKHCNIPDIVQGQFTVKMKCSDFDIRTKPCDSIELNLNVFREMLR